MEERGLLRRMTGNSETMQQVPHFFPLPGKK
jgi:hypothetical protein